MNYSHFITYITLESLANLNENFGINIFVPTKFRKHNCDNAYCHPKSFTSCLDQEVIPLAFYN